MNTEDRHVDTGVVGGEPVEQAFAFKQYQGRHYVVYPDGEVTGLMSRIAANGYADIFYGEVKRLPYRQGRIVLLASCLGLAFMVGAMVL